MRTVLLVFAIVLASSGATAQDITKPWTEWSKKDAEKVLNDSAWGQTYLQEAAQSPAAGAAVTRTSGGLTSTDPRSVESGQAKAPPALKYRARFLTAKPVRQAFSRLIVLSQPSAPADLVSQLQGFVDRDFGDYLVVAFSIDSEDQRVATGASMVLARLTADALKDKVYLETKDGKRATFIDYKAPVADGMGAKFVFSRTLDGQPFLAENAESVKFYVQLSDKQKISMKFKVAGMSYGGKLEY